MKEILKKHLQDVLEKLEIKDIEVYIENIKDSNNGDFASNVAMLLAKSLKQNPKEIAKKIIENLPKTDLYVKVEVAGPGFINFFQNKNFLAQKLIQKLQDKTFIKKTQNQKIVIDVSSPNLAKEMHVGHLRSTIIGDCIGNVLEALGNEVIRQNHVGDWGTQFGMLLAFLQKNQTSDDLKDLEIFYQKAKQEFDKNQEFAKSARQKVVELQSGNLECLQLWQKFTEISLNHCQHIYDVLHVNLKKEDVKGESFYNQFLPKIIQFLEKRNLITVDQGAKCVFLDEFVNQKNEKIPFIVQKTDGAYLYSTTDLAAVNYRTEVLKAQKIIYFVDQRQALHLQMVFTVSNKSGLNKNNAELIHMGFGTLNGEDGKPFKTRDGKTVKLIELITQAQNKALTIVKSKNSNFNESQINQIANAVAINAVKYADLSKYRISDYNFNINEMLSFEGNTAPYIMYAYSRIKSIIKKAQIRVENLNELNLNHSHHEFLLAKELDKFEDVIIQVANRGFPHLLCNYLFDLATAFSRFYENCEILNTNNEIKKSRLALTIITGEILKKSFGLLGLLTIEKM